MIDERFPAQGKTPIRIAGLDLGQAADRSALAIVDASAKLVCRALKRWPLHTPYLKVAEEVTALGKCGPLERAILVVDATGVGRPVVEMLRACEHSARILPVMITGGRSASMVRGYAHVPKAMLIRALYAAIGSRRLEFAAGLREAAALVGELLNFRVEVTRARNERFGAASGGHDDLVLALALAVWRAGVRGG